MSKKLNAVTRGYPATTMPNLVAYMILSAVKGSRGAPVALYWDPFKARADFDAIVTSWILPDKQAFLVSYEIQPDGSLRELAELGAK